MATRARHDEVVIYPARWLRLWKFSLSIWKLKQKNRKLSNKLRTDHLIMRVGIFWNNRRPRVKFNSSHWTTTIQLDLNAYSKITTHVFLKLTLLSYYSFVLLKLFRLVLRGARCPLIPINTSKIKPNRWRLRCLGAAFQSLVKCNSNKYRRIDSIKWIYFECFFHCISFFSFSFLKYI